MIMRSRAEFEKYAKNCKYRFESGTTTMQKPLFSDFKPENPSDQEDSVSARDLLKQLGISFEYITDPIDAELAVADLIEFGNPPLGIDTETAKLKAFRGHPKTGLDPHLSQIRLIQIYDGNRVYIFDMFHMNIEVFTQLWRLPMIAHNAVFDLKHLFHAGALPQKIGCTMLMGNALTGRLRSLAGLVKEYMGWNISKAQQVSDWRQYELTNDQLCYAALDAVLVKKLHAILVNHLKKGGRVTTYMLMRDAMPAIAQLELNGVFFDTSRHARLMESWQEKKTEAAEKLQAVLGLYVSPDSPKQLSDWLKGNLGPGEIKAWPKTKTGQLKTDARTLARYPDHPLAAPLLLYKEADKMLSTFGVGYTDHINPKTGRIHASFRIGGTATGRLSCHSPNIQNPPRNFEFRACFSAPTGRSILAADYAQIELRVAAAVSRDRNMLRIYDSGQDLHRMTAAAVAGIAPEQVTKEQRQAAKPVNFGLLYGQGYRALAQYAKANYGVQMSEADAQKARNTFFRTYPDLKRWQQKTASEAERTKRVTTPCGRLRDFSKEERGYRYTEALNTPIQGGAAEVLMAALALLPRYLNGLDAKLVNIVHDEIALEVADSDLERAKAALEKAMIEGMRVVFPNASTKNLVEAKSGKNWAEAK